jgi:DNA repair photolyase
MANGSSIEWTEATWNPVTGCTKISAGCKHCYAERMAKRLQAMGMPQYVDGFKVTLQPQALELPYKWKKPLTWEKDLKAWIKDWRDQNLLSIKGLADGERTPKTEKNHSLQLGDSATLS